MQFCFPRTRRFSHLARAACCIIFCTDRLHKAFNPFSHGHLGASIVCLKTITKSVSGTLKTDLFRLNSRQFCRHKSVLPLEVVAIGVNTACPSLWPLGQDGVTVLLGWDLTYLCNDCGLQSIQGWKLPASEWCLNPVEEPEITR